MIIRPALALLSLALGAGPLSATALEGAIHPVTTDSNIQEVINSAAPGDTLIFEPGIYGLTDTLILKSHLHLYAKPGVTLQSRSGHSGMKGTDIAQVTIEGFFFSGGFGVSDACHAAIMLVRAAQVKILKNRFEGMTCDAAVFAYDSSDLTVDYNTASNLRQFMSLHPDADKPRTNVSISHNTLGPNINRMAIESFGPTINLRVDSNVITGTTYTQPAVSLVEGGAEPAGPVSVRGNRFACGPWSFELSCRDMTVEHNTFADHTWGLSFSRTPGCLVQSNTFVNVTNPFNKCGASYTGEQIILTNTIDGIEVFGWSKL